MAEAAPSCGVRVQFPDGYVELSDEERRAVLKSAAECGADRAEVRADGDCLKVKYLRDGPRFERIRRITGYLVGTLERFNDAKRAEERDRVKHGVEVTSDE